MTMKREGDVVWEHLGDGVYAGYDGYGIWLHANDHKAPTDRIYLEPEVFEALVRFPITAMKFMDGGGI